MFEWKTNKELQAHFIMMWILRGTVDIDPARGDLEPIGNGRRRRSDYIIPAIYIGRLCLCMFLSLRSVLRELPA